MFSSQRNVLRQLEEFESLSEVKTEDSSAFELFSIVAWPMIELSSN